MVETDSRRSRRGFFLPLILLALGAPLLLNNFGLLSWGFWSVLWRFWPVLLILLGIEWLLGRSSPWLAGLVGLLVIVATVIAALILAGGTSGPFAASAVGNEQISEQLGEATSADVEIEFGAGQLILASLARDSQSLFEANVSHGQSGRSVDKTITRSDGVAHLRLGSSGSAPVVFGTSGNEIWNLALTPSVPLTLRLTTGASENSLDLSKLNVGDLNVEVGAGSANIILPAAGSTRATVKAGASSINISIPQGVAARINGQVGLGTLNVDSSRFSHRGNSYVSPDFDTAANKVELNVEGGMGSINIR